MRERILRPIEQNEYGVLNPMTAAEQEVEQYIRGQFGNIFVSDLVRTFASRPFGWSDVATLYFLNELRRRGRWTLKYNNDANIDSRIVAQNLLKEQSKFTVVAATSISQELINEFVEAWKYSLNTPSAPASYDSGELFRLCKTSASGEKHVSIQSIRHNYSQLRKDIAAYPFVSVIDEALDLLEHWDEERDHKRFFEMVIEERETAQKIFDRCKSLISFVKDHASAYLNIRNFVTENKENFNFLNAPEKVNELQQILSDQWPMPNMKRYSQLNKELARALEQVKAEKKAEIERRYQMVFEDLKQMAADTGVDYTLDEQKVIQTKTASHNLYVLDNNLNTMDYRAEQAKEIMKRKNEQESANDSEKPKRRIRMVSLHTGSAKPINTEEDVDNYLAKLKVELMKYVNSRDEHDDILIK